MQQLHTTTETQNENTLSYAPTGTVTTLEHGLTQIEATKEQQEQREQSGVVERLLASLEQNAKKQRGWKQNTIGVINNLRAGILGCVGHDMASFEAGRRDMERPFLLCLCRIRDWLDFRLLVLGQKSGCRTDDHE